MQAYKVLSSLCLMFLRSKNRLNSFVRDTVFNEFISVASDDCTVKFKLMSQVVED